MRDTCARCDMRTWVRNLRSDAGTTWFASWALPPDRIAVAPPGHRNSLSPPRRGFGEYFLFIAAHPNRTCIAADAVAISRELPEQLRIVGQWLPNQLEDLQRTLHAKGLAAASIIWAICAGSRT